MKERNASIVREIAGLLLVLMAVAAPVRSIESAQSCLAANREARTQAGAAGAIACFNENLAEIAERKAEIETLMRAVQRCRGPFDGLSGLSVECPAGLKPLGGYTNRVPHNVTGGSCRQAWNQFVQSRLSHLEFGCRLVAERRELNMDDEGRLRVRMLKPDDDLIEDVAYFHETEEEAERHYRNFDGCFARCLDEEFSYISQRYGLDGYLDLRQRYQSLVATYKSERLEPVFAEHAEMCNLISRRWWDRVSEQEKSHLVCEQWSRRGGP